MQMTIWVSRDHKQALMTGSKNSPVSLFPSYLFQYDNLESPNVMGSDPAILVVNFSYFCDSYVFFA